MQNGLSKTCVACGLQKPITAFLQISGPEGTSYGNVCSTCRGSGLGKKITIPKADSEERGSSSIGLKIDAKAKIQIELEKKRQLEDKKARESKAEQKRENVADEKSERKESKEQAERDHRENYLLAKKKDGFLNYQSTKNPQATLPRAAQEKDNAVKKSFLEAQTSVDIQQKNDHSKTEEIKHNIDLQHTHLDPQAGEAKYQSAEFLKTVDALFGNSAAISTIKRQFLAGKENPGNKIATKENTPAEKKDEVMDYINETWQPSSPKSRR